MVERWIPGHLSQAREHLQTPELQTVYLTVTLIKWFRVKGTMLSLVSSAPLDKLFNCSQYHQQNGG